MYIRTETVVLESRTGLALHNFATNRNELKLFFDQYPDLFFDGELYTQDVHFETVNGLVRLQGRANNQQLFTMEKIMYHIYDVYDPKNISWIFSQRRYVYIYIGDWKICIHLFAFKYMDVCIFENNNMYTCIYVHMYTLFSRNFLLALEERFSSSLTKIVIVKTENASNVSDIKRLHDSYVQEVYMHACTFLPKYPYIHIWIYIYTSVFIRVMKD
jgi:hypothetical protein